MPESMRPAGSDQRSSLGARRSREARRFSALALAGWIACAVPAFAQTGSGIAGVVKDASGGVLPGVTVEVSSPALIEGTRSTASDAGGQYQIIDLRPGEYSVTFTLT